MSAALLLPTAATPQEVPACLQATADQARALALARRNSSDCPVQCQGCGCKGGPGYRSRRTHHCVGYADLVRECGPPPHERCDRECFPVAATCRRPTEAEVGAARQALASGRRPCASGYRHADSGRCIAKRKVVAVCGEPPGTACIADTAGAGSAAPITDDQTPDDQSPPDPVPEAPSPSDAAPPTQ